MSAAVKIIKTNKDVNNDVILGAVNSNKPITIKTYYLTDSSQESLRNIVTLVLEKYDKLDSMEACYNSIRGLMVNATKANIKRILFKKLGLDITDPNEYLKGMEKIEKELDESNFYKYKNALMKQNLTVKTTFTFNSEMFSITVKNNFVLLPHEYHLTQKTDIEKPVTINNHYAPKLKEESEGLMSNSSKVISLDQYKMDQQIISQISSEETNETIVKLDIVLKDKNTFNTETFSQQIDALYANYKTQFGEALEETIDETSERKYVTVSTNLSKSLSGSLRGRGEFLNLLTRIQNLDSQLYREQQLLLANYGENVFKTIQDKLNKAKVESNEIIAQIQKVGHDTFDLNKKQIEMFVKQRDVELEKQINSEIKKHKQKLDEFNSSLDSRIENQSIILKAQADQHLEQMKENGTQFIESTSTKMTKIKDDFKADLESEINIVELLKHELLIEIGSEKEELEKSLENIQNEIRKVEKFNTNNEVMDNLIRQSDEAFWKMSTNIEVIKAKEESINNFMSNISLLETAIRETEQELKLLDREKTDFLNEKGKVIQTVDSKIKQMEKFGEEVKQKLVEITGFERKLNIISGSLTEQVKKTKVVDEQLAKFSKEVSSLELKRNDLNHFVSEVDQKVALINSKTADIKLMESKFHHIESMMIDLSARHKQIITMEERLNGMKGNIEKLLVQADDKIAKINSAVSTTKTGKGRTKKIPPKLSGVVQEIRDNVISLKKKRQSIPEIAKTLDISEEIVSMILAMR
ncbi:MAG: hypothetical protein KBA66_07250 [Leptospiraceae bacterium]|nr:hypothetical protein [Leptospiraceae bacterium]